MITVELDVYRNHWGYRTPPGPTFKDQYLRSEEGADPKQYVFGCVSTRSFGATFLFRH